MSGNLDDNKPPVNVEFTQVEKAEIQKTVGMIQQNFLRQHQEITASSNRDLTDMIRQEKQVYSNLAILYAVNALRAIEKVKKT